MTFFTTKVFKGKEYIYLVKTEWIEGRSKRTFQKYIGPREKFPDLVIGKRSKQLKEQPTVLPKKVYEFGISAALWTIARELDLPGIIDRAIGEQKAPHLTMGEYITLAAINRVDDPGSKSQLSSWFGKS